ncbi:MAG: 3-oxoacyl-[acyl-carrier-protein] synthase III C-terminal domain-containing protein [Verrucomicrobiota bacterium]
MFLTGFGTANPAWRYRQSECWEALQASTRFRELSPRSHAVLSKVLTGNSGIETRHLALERLDQAFDLTPDALQARFAQHAPALAEAAALRALAHAKLDPSDIDAILISTCTGYLCPGLTSYVGERLGLRPEVFGLDLVGQGCGAALPNLRAAEALIASGRCRHALCICVEVCSAAFYLDDNVGVLISACLFGDGAGAVIASAGPGSGRRIRWHGGRSLLRPEHRDFLRFEHRGGMLRNILAPEVPGLAAKHVESVLRQTLQAQGLAPEQVAGWILHPGGREVLAALRRQLKLSAHDVRWSESVLREYGNMSSPSVLFILKDALSDGVPGGWWWMSSFGAGFSCHGALLEVD